MKEVFLKKKANKAYPAQKITRQEKKHQKAAIRARERRQNELNKIAKKQEKANKRIEQLKAKGLANNGAKIRKPRFTDEQLSRKRALLRIAEQQSPNADWVHLDNAAMIFPSTDTPDINGMFRLSAILKEKIDPYTLQHALNSTMRRFPTITSSIKRGVFWYYLEPSIYPLVVEEERLFPCTRIPMDSRHAGIRVTYFDYRISVDFFHAVTDGSGGIVFLNTLVGAYLRLIGVEIKDKEYYLDDRDKPQREEAIDSFMQMADLKSPKIAKDVVSFQIPGQRLNNFSLIVVNGSMDSSQLNRVAKERGVTITQLLAAVIAWAIEEERRFFGYSKKRPVVISVPANLRKYYPTPSLRNFVTVMSIHSNGSTDFDSILKTVKEQFIQQNNMEYFMGTINFNVKSQRNFLIKICPLVLKNIILKIAFEKYGAKARTSTISNLGIVKPPKEFSEHVCRYEFILGPQKREMVSFSCCTYQNKTVVSVSRTIKESGIVRLFFTKLAELGLSIDVDTNCDI